MSRLKKFGVITVRMNQVAARLVKKPLKNLAVAGVKREFINVILVDFVLDTRENHLLEIL